MIHMRQLEWRLKDVVLLAELRYNERKNRFPQMFTITLFLTHN